MVDKKKPTIGVLGIMQELYDKTYPKIVETQSNYVKDVIKELGDIAEFKFIKPARNRKDIEEIVETYNNDKEIDGIMIMMLTYSPGQRIVPALKKNNLPIMLANIQPLSSVTKDWDMELLTYNQGIHGAQDNMNAIVRLGINCPVVTGNWKEEEFKNFVKDWSLAAQAAKACKNLRIAVVGKMPGMGDITFDSSALLKKLGVEIVDESMGKVYSYFEKVTKKEIEDVKAENAKNFEIDPNLKEDQHDFAAKFQVAIEKFLEDNKYDGYSIYFDSVKDDGRFEQLPLMAASNLMAKGYGYGAEGDALAATVVKIGHILGTNGHFTEMYAMDFERDSVFMSHMGEGNWKVARKDKPIKLIDRFLGIGDLNNPPTVVFNVQPGEGTITSLAPLSEGNFRLVVSKGEVIDSQNYPNVEMPYFHFKPDTGVRNAITNWLTNGGTHHQCFNIGDITRRWELFAKMVGIEYVRV